MMSLTFATETTFIHFAARSNQKWSCKASAV